MFKVRVKVLIVWEGKKKKKKKEVFREGREKKNKKIASLKVQLFQKSEPANKVVNTERALPQSRETLFQTSGKSPKLELKEKSGAPEGF